VVSLFTFSSSPVGLGTACKAHTKSMSCSDMFCHLRELITKNTMQEASRIPGWDPEKALL